MSSSTGTVVFNDSRIKANGVIATESIGVGTANPTSNLHVVGDINFTGNLYQNSNIFTSGGSSNIWNESNIALSNLYWDATTSKLGIGTNAPAYTLDVTGDINFSGSLYENGVAFSGGGGGSSVWTATGSDIYYNSGNVGIGTSSPQTKLHLFRTDAATLISRSESNASGYAVYNHYYNSGSGSSGYCGVDGVGLFNHSAGALALGTNNTPIIFSPSYSTGEKMRLDTSGNVGIGTTNPSTKLHINHTSDYSDLLTLRGKDTNGDNTISGGILFNHVSGHASGYRGITWYSGNPGFFMGGVTMAVGGGWNLCRIAFHAAKNQSNGSTVRAYIDGNGTGSDLNFTGQHRCFIKEIPFTNIENFEGLIVSANQNEYVKMTDGVKTGSNAITMNESLPVVSLSTKVNDKKCFGVISASEDPETRENRYGNLVSVFEKELGDTRVYINSLGEGAIWVVNTAGALESGDYITTSNVAGYGQKQDSEFLANYTVAKITMDCDFAPATQPIQIILKELSNVNYWVKTTYSNVSFEEYLNLAEDVRTTTTEIYYSNEDGEITTDKYNTLESNVQSTYTELTRTIHQKISTEESKTEREGSTLEVRQELINVLDEHGQLQWEDDPSGATEKAYKIRYLDTDGNITDEANAVHIAAFVGCTYHCG